MEMHISTIHLAFQKKKKMERNLSGKKDLKGPLYFTVAEEGKKHNKNLEEYLQFPHVLHQVLQHICILRSIALVSL